MLAEGSDDIDNGVAREAGLYSHEIDEGGHVGSMSNLAVLLEAGMDGVEKDLGRAVQGLSVKEMTHLQCFVLRRYCREGEKVLKYTLVVLGICLRRRRMVEI